MNHRFKVGDKVIIDGTEIFGVRHGKVCIVARCNKITTSYGDKEPIYYVKDIGNESLDFMEYERNLRPYTDEYRLLYETN